jgi:predicted secreted protein
MGLSGEIMKIAIKIVAACALSIKLMGAIAQPIPAPVQNVVQLSASASVEEPQDFLTLSMSTTRDGSEAPSVQDQLKSTLESALNEARLSAQPGAMEVRTGHFSLTPRYGRDGRINGWRGSAELVLEGRDFARISSAAGNIQGLTVSGVAFSLSREQRSRVEAQAQALAIERFKARASEIARAFGFAGYTLREVAVTTADQGLMPRQRLMNLEARSSMAEAPLPLEAGKGTVQVTVNGSVQLK